MEKILIAMSGGVDSSAAAHLISSQGYDAIGATMVVTRGLYGNPDGASADALMAAKICEKLNIDHVTVDLCDEFKRYVVTDFVDRYLEGKTPNPCIVCNKKIKFGALLDYAVNTGCDKIATGHYAKVERDASGRFILKTATDSAKDQSYMLWSLSQEQLSRCVFPLGSLTKPEVREMALDLTFENAEQKDSQDVCFIPDGDYATFIKHFTDAPMPYGDFVDMQGNTLGKHKGIIHYTVGQRKGLGISLGRPMFVHSKSADDNRVVLCDNDQLFSKNLTASNINLIATDRLDSPIRVLAKTRYHQIPVMATVNQTDEDKLSVEFDQPVRAISRGQSLVLYDGDVVIGGGFID